jgi:hypothetical protein
MRDGAMVVLSYMCMYQFHAGVGDHLPGVTFNNDIARVKNRRAASASRRAETNTSISYTFTVRG